MTRQLVTNSRLKTWQSCQRLHLYLYELGYRSVVTPYELWFGTTGHAAAEEWWKCWKDGRGDQALESALAVLKSLVEDEFELARFTVLMTGYDTRWAPAMADITVLDVEREFRFPTGAGFDFGGKIDVIIERNGVHGIVEHKFTSADLSPASDYWRGLRLEPQASHYFRGAKSLGYDPKFTLWDAIKRAEIKPLKETPEEDREYVKSGPRKGLLYKGQRDHDETPEEHGARLADMIAASPETWYARSEVVRTEREIVEFEDDVMELGEQCTAERYRARNPDSCRKYGRTCAFLPVCDGTGSIEDQSKYVQSDQTHPELKEVA